ncbi:MAG: hypothetical protein ACRC7O_13210 [Fimbriiglobus sp.]
MTDIGVSDGIRHPPDPNEPSLSFADDGYYWFLHPLFERLRTETGQYVDLYGDAIFAGPRLTALGRMLAEARQLVEAQPEFWKVHTGTQLLPTRREVFQPVERAAFLRLLGVWEQTVQRAEKSGRAVICVGD